MAMVVVRFGEIEKLVQKSQQVPCASVSFEAFVHNTEPAAAECPSEQ